MILHDRKLIFVHVPKSAGKSVRSALRSAAMPRHRQVLRYAAARLFNADLYGLDAAGGHGSALDHRAVLGPERFAEYLSFCFVRNPWDRMVSIWSFRKLRPKSPTYELAVSGSLADFVSHWERTPFAQQIDYLTDEKGQIIVDMVGRFENLAEDFAAVCDRAGLSARLPHRNPSQRDTFRSYYDDDLAERVGRLFARDIEAFGYTF